MLVFVLYHVQHFAEVFKSMSLAPCHIYSLSYPSRGVHMGSKHVTLFHKNIIAQNHHGLYKNTQLRGQ